MGGASSESHAIIAEDSKDPQESPVFRHSTTLTENRGKLVSTLRSFPKAKTAVQLLKSGAKHYNSLQCYGEREVLKNGSAGEYQWISFREFEQKVEMFSAGLASLGISRNDKVSIICKNCILWQVSTFACYKLGLIPVPIGESVFIQHIKLILEHSECNTIILSYKIAEEIISILDSLPNIKNVILIGTNEQSKVVGNVNFWNTFDIFEFGKNKNCIYPKIQPDDIAIILYTTSINGCPKGSILSHRNLIAGAAGLSNLGTSVSTCDTYLSFLPLAYIYEIGVELVMFGQGTSVGFYSGQIKNLMDDIKTLQPTILCGVPRVWNRFVEGMKMEINKQSSLKQLLISIAMASKTSDLQSNRAHSLFYDQTIFRQFSDELGGKVRLIVSGGAPMKPEVFQFLRSTITPNIVQGYGLTETSGIVAVGEVSATSAPTNGYVSISCEIKLRSIDGYCYNPREDPMCGEIYVRGPNVFKGYHKNPEMTSYAMDGDWFRTGDIGKITAEGKLQIIDHVKPLIKLSQGEYISVPYITEVYKETEGVHQIFIFADSQLDYPIAVVIPTELQQREWKTRGIYDFVCSQSCEEEFIKRFDQIARNKHLRSFEFIKMIVLDNEEFSIENGLLSYDNQLQIQTLKKKYEGRILNRLGKLSPYEAYMPDYIRKLKSMADD